MKALSDLTPEITANSEITLHFAIALCDGTTITSTFEGDPITLTLGTGSLIDNLEKTLFGLKAGEKQSLLLEADNAFGPRDEEKAYAMPRSSFPEEMALEPELVISFSTPAGDELAGIVMELDEEQVKIDFNHPLAGNDIVFTVQIINVNNPE
ncbi:MAG: peptidylprolyl isomerase [Sedimenticola selenatireducens]|uniref:Peptidyl-prolyl cis-trans isomerase n=1 Tax=Sedimenticola selenatireducens TaxID=191960 RepID=A0A557SLU0_9GAMM|nr:peptidylprolyl isomerase [Sedimenticola selenatireducens]TVT62757.1 MAG: peptidylprolyl isomerase [Sedimenticola selenatireducens]